MKIELEFKDENEFSDFISGLNNAIIAYDDIRNAILFGCEVSLKWSKLSEEQLRHRVEILHKKYFELLDLEKEFHT